MTDKEEFAEYLDKWFQETILDGYKKACIKHPELTLWLPKIDDHSFKESLELFELKKKNNGY